MQTLAILPVKPFERAKQRLEEGLAAGPRRALAEAMYADMLTALRRADTVDHVVVVTADPAAQRVAQGYDATALDDPAENGQNAAVGRAVAHALELGATRVVCVSGDCPLIDPRELDALLGRPRLAPRYAIIVPDRHATGTNALVLSPPDAMRTAYGRGSLVRHQQLAAEAGIAVEVAELSSLALDIDTPEDLALMREVLRERRGGAAHTRGMLNQLVRADLKQR